jgi:hypothetical protein
MDARCLREQRSRATCVELMRINKKQGVALWVLGLCSFLPSLARVNTEYP